MLYVEWVLRIKKTLFHPGADAGARHIFREKMNRYKAYKRSIVYVDERGIDHDMPRAHGYAPIGQRCYGKKNWHAKGRTNAIGALIGKMLLTVCLFETNINAYIFYAWTVKDLIPKLTKKSVSKVIGFIKGKSSIWIAQNIANKKRNFVCHKFWSRGYFVSTVGADQTIICSYIQDQEKEDKRLDNLFNRS